MRMSMVMCLVMTVVIGTAAADEAGQVAPYFGETVIAVLRVDVAQVDGPQVVALITGDGQSEGSQGLAGHIGTFIDKLRAANVQHVYGVYSLRDIGRETPYLIVPTADHATADALAKALLNGGAADRRLDGPLEPSTADYFEVTEAIDSVVFCGSKSARRRMGTEPVAERAGLAGALAAVETAPAAMVYAPTVDQQRVLGEMLPELPAEMGGLNGYALAGLSWVAASDTADGRLQVAFGASDAQTIAPILGAAAALVPGSESQSDDARGSVTLPLVDGKPAISLANVMSRFGGLSNQFDSMQTLKQIALAMHNFHDAYGSFPPTASYDGDKPLLSWRVHLLPYLGAGGLYSQFHLDEPWDSEHNRQLIDRMPDAFKSTDFLLNMQGKTTFVVPVGEQTVFHGQAGTEIKEVTDGTSNTIMALQTTPDHAVIWTKPDDLQIDMDNVTVGIIGPGERFVCVFCDGAGHRLATSIPPATLKAVLTRAGAETFDWDTAR